MNVIFERHIPILAKRFDQMFKQFRCGVRESSSSDGKPFSPLPHFFLQQRLMLWRKRFTLAGWFESLHCTVLHFKTIAWLWYCRSIYPVVWSNITRPMYQTFRKTPCSSQVRVLTTALVNYLCCSSNKGCSDVKRYLTKKVKIRAIFREIMRREALPSEAPFVNAFCAFSNALIQWYALFVK